MMSSHLKALPARLYVALDWFIPPHLKTGSDMLRRVRMFLVSHIFGPFIGHTVTLTLVALDPDPGAQWYLLFGAISSFWLFPFLLRAGAPYVPLALASVQILTFSILSGCYHYGGLTSPLMPWMITVPLLAFFYLGLSRTVQVTVLGMILADLTLFYLISDGGHSFPLHVPHDQLTPLGIISTLCAAAYVSMMALYYASIVNSQSELERELLRRIETAEELRAAARAANLANQAKSEFLAKMSHELRTPLNAVIGYSDMLLEDAEAEQRVQQCSDLMKIRSAGHHLLALINDLLELSKLDAGKMQIYAEPTDLPSFFADVAANAEQPVLAGNNRLILDVPDDLGRVQADAAKLGAAIGNLVSNAAKFTRNGRVTITVRRDGNELSVAIADTGRGIDPRRMANLFENFDEDETATTSSYGGTGLGLALSRKLVRLMGGDLYVQSELGVGSVFTLRLPVIPAAQAGEEADDLDHPSGTVSLPPHRPHQRPRILVIDDDAAVLDLAQRLLEREGYETAIAASGFDGLALARSLLPSLILLDVNMPELNGWQVLRALHGDHATQAIPVMVLTVEDAAHQARQHGASAHLRKPIDSAVLLQAIQRLLPRDEPGAMPAPLAA